MKKNYEAMTDEEIVENSLASIDKVSDMVWKLVQIRKQKGITQKEVAKFMGVNQSAIARFENMLVIPKANTLVHYASAIGESIDIKTKEIHRYEIILKESFEYFEGKNPFQYGVFEKKIGSAKTNVAKANLTYTA